MGLKSKDLLGMKQLSAEEIMEILDTAKLHLPSDQACISGVPASITSGSNLIERFR